MTEQQQNDIIAYYNKIRMDEDAASEREQTWSDKLQEVRRENDAKRIRRAERKLEEAQSAFHGCISAYKIIADTLNILGYEVVTDDCGVAVEIIKIDGGEDEH